MTTIVASPPTLTSLPRSTWDGSLSNGGGFTAMSNEDVSRIFMPQRKVVTRSSSSSSLNSNASTASNTSTASSNTVTSINDASHTANGDVGLVSKKKQRGGFWPVSKAESTSSVTNARANGAVQPAAPTNGSTPLTQKAPVTPVVPEQSSNVVNGNMSRPQTTALLVLLPMNGTFERKQINVPVAPDPPQKIGRQTNNKTTPKHDNGYFDSKVLSRQHAEIFADAQGRVFIKDVKSSNGTFVNAERLSPENRESEPRELRQGDSLELGIDIVSEDQKTIVHHKVSAKVEFSGFPGKAGNALDLLNFGELDVPTTQMRPMSSPMVHSRSQQGRPMDGRASVASSMTGVSVNTGAHRQANYWGTPLNIEALVKQVGIEMRAAKQQARELDQAKTYVSSLLPADGSPARLPPHSKDTRSSGRGKSTRIDHSARFSEPPAPPPQQPLPEKPDSARGGMPGLKRDNTTRPLVNGTNASPTGGQSSQILTLLNELKEAQKQIELQGTRVKELEETLKQEKKAREVAEDKVKRLEIIAASKPISSEDKSAVSNKSIDPASTADEHERVESEIQSRLEYALTEMQSMQKTLEQTTQRADHAEAERSTLADLIEKYRKERSDNGDTADPNEADIEEIIRADSISPTSNGKGLQYTNGHVKSPKLPADLQNAVSTLLQQQHHGTSDVPPQYAPYVSMVGVVLIGVGIMAYLNSWQKVDK